jgi:quinol monooxygenase YgiN
VPTTVPVSRQSSFHVVAEYSVIAGCEGEVLEHLAELAAVSRTEPGNLSYNYFQDVEDPRHIVIVERYETEEAFAKHLASAHFAVLGKAQIIPLLADRQVRTFTHMTGHPR